MFIDQPVLSLYNEIRHGNNIGVNVMGRVQILLLSDYACNITTTASAMSCIESKTLHDVAWWDKRPRLAEPYFGACIYQESRPVRMELKIANQVSFQLNDVRIEFTRNETYSTLYSSYHSVVVHKHCA